MLQTVLGLDAARIASAFLLSPAAMGQRLVRAKAKIRDARIAFTEPDAVDLPARTEAVLSAIYAAFGSGWEAGPGADAGHKGLAEEAIWLARVLVSLMSREPEALGLLALMLYAAARIPARRTADGVFVPLDVQDTRLWAHDQIAEAECLLGTAATCGRIGRFQIEAAIQSVHCQRAVTRRTNWAALATLHDGLAVLSPTTGALISRAAVLGESRGAEAGLALLDELPPELVRSYQPYWAVRAHLMARLGRAEESRDAYRMAIGLTEDPAVRAFLIGKTGLGGDPA